MVAFPNTIRPALWITPSVKDGRDEDPILFECVEDKVWESPEERLPGSQGDDLMPFR